MGIWFFFWQRDVRKFSLSRHVKQFCQVCFSRSFNFQLARVIMVKKFDVSVIVEELYMACVKVNNLYIVCDGQEDAVFF